MQYFPVAVTKHPNEAIQYSSRSDTEQKLETLSHTAQRTRNMVPKQTQGHEFNPHIPGAGENAIL